MAKNKNFNWMDNEETTTSEIEVFDANGNRLQDGDTVIAIKDLKVK
jgi:hypothetical protein